jgi:hypothetical protein
MTYIQYVKRIRRLKDELRKLDKSSTSKKTTKE